ncbi:MAG: hypothetical protein PHF67_02815 [Candidatus Nanoarchaeia archaeon]|nr:hypothetical protein [Candidatus Nanoarchaeia archaeon]
MSLTLSELLKISAKIDYGDPILQRVTNDAMIGYLSRRGFTCKIIHDSGLAAYVHPTVKVTTPGLEYNFSTGIDTKDDRTQLGEHSGNVIQFFLDMQTFYQLKGEPIPTQLEILNELL